MPQAFVDNLERLLSAEETLLEKLKNTRAASNLSAGRKKLLRHLRALSRSDDLSLMITSEKAIIQGDLLRYANSAAMVSSLKKALEGMDIIERHIALVSDRDRYRIIDQGHQMAKNRRAGLPFDEARQALAGHHARLANLDKSRLDEDDKELIEIRKAVIVNATQRYLQRQASILGLDLPP